ncbi:hypothetical protein [Streptomyces viridochromogenes]|nr:hypothetical protein [Streptomyces viridochromogenes]
MSGLRTQAYGSSLEEPVPAGGTAKATARSTRDLGGEVRAEVARAVRY